MLLKQMKVKLNFIVKFIVCEDVNSTSQRIL